MKFIPLSDLFQTLTAGGRSGGEKSRARPAREYGDPARHIKFEGEKGKTMPKISVGVANETFSERDPVDAVLDVWARYLSLSDHQISLIEGNPTDTKEFMRLGEAVETMVNDLRRHQWWAVRKSKGFCTQWIFQDAIYEQSLLQAKEILEKKMRGHIACARYFGKSSS